MTIDNRKLIELMRKRRVRPEPGESLFLAVLFMAAGLALLAHWAGVL
jgi:hypothetical protein